MRKIKQKMDELSLMTAMINWNDLSAAGKMINLSEEMISVIPVKYQDDLEPVIFMLIQNLESFIMRDTNDKEKAVQQIEHTIANLQDMVSDIDLTGSCPGKGKLVSQSPAASLSIQNGAITENGEEEQKAGAADTLSVEKWMVHESGERVIERTLKSEMEDPDLFAEFISESQEHLDSIEEKILELETDPENNVLLNDIFRPLHTIKGVSAFLSLNHINLLSHESETFLDLARSRKILMDRECIDLVFEVVDVLGKLIQLLDVQLKGGSFEDDDYPHVECLIADIKELVKTKQAGSTTIVQKNGTPPEKKIGEILIEENIVAESDVEAALEKQRESTQSKKVGNILIEEKKATIKQVSQALRVQKDFSLQQKSEVIKVDTKKLDNLLDMVGELVIAQTLVSQHRLIVENEDITMSKNVEHASKIVRDIQDSSMSLRMIPVQQTFQKMNRLVRDLSNKSGKNIVLEISGADTEVDRNVIEQINDPLVHMVRNSVDHGIEMPEERIRKGKAASGKICLNAFHQGGSIVIEIGDDGKGLDKESIKNKAVEKQIISKSDNLSDDEIFNLIFEPGFSTAKKITDISGRGVGMDVVKKNIEKLNGNVSISSEAGKGSMFTIRLPLTMAILDGMVIKVGEERYLLPVLSIQESIRPANKDVITVQGKGEMVKVRGHLIPLIRIHRLFDFDPEFNNPSEAIVVVVDLMGKTYGMLVDRLIGQQQVVIKSLKSSLVKTQGVSGSAIMGDGRVGLILDVKGLVELSRNSGHKPIKKPVRDLSKKPETEAEPDIQDTTERLAA